jgi:SAM-dependent methyltransferase
MGVPARPTVQWREPDGAAASFDAFAEEYQATVERSVRFTGRNLEFFHLRKVELLRRVGRRHFDGMEAVSVLNVGCGSGVTDSLLRPYVGSLHGVEVSPGMVELARRQNPDCVYGLYDGETLPYPDGAFDMVLTICVLHHVPPRQWEAFIAELVRVAAPGGVVVVIEHNRLNPLTRRAVNTCELDADAVLVPQRVAARLLEAGGAGPVEVHNFLFSPFPGRLGTALDRRLAGLSIGGQYAAVARRRIPRPLAQPAGPEASSRRLSSPE